MKFDMPMVWKKPNCHAINCYFCLSKKNGFGKNVKWSYAQVDSVIFPEPHSSDVLYPVCRDSDLQNVVLSEDTAESSDFESETERQLLSQRELNDLVRDLELTKEKSELLASRLQQRGFLAAGVKTTIYRSRHESYAQFFTKENQICYCNDVSGLFKKLHQAHNPNEWRLFIDGSKESLKAVLLHNGNEKPSVPIAHAVNTKETHEIMVKLLECIKYKKYEWKICSDLKVVGMLCGMQGGYTRHCCFLCLWNSRADALHYKQKEWPARTNTVVGEANIKYDPIVKRKNIILPALHIKLGLIKNFAKKLDKEGRAFAHLRSIFTHLSYAKVKEGVFAGPEIKKVAER